MLPYHGTPLTPESAAAVVLAARHAMVSFAHQQSIGIVAEVCQSFALDNGAFSAWRGGEAIVDWNPFYEWVQKWERHPGFDWFLIPDVIDGDERHNDALLESCQLAGGVPIWHLHESLDRLDRLSRAWPRVALGSSGEFAEVKTRRWWKRMADAMEVVCDEEGRPRTKLHGLRMLDPEIFTRFPFASADSTNVARNIGYDGRWKGPYEPAGKAAKGIVNAGRIEAFQSAERWLSIEVEQFRLELLASPERE